MAAVLVAGGGPTEVDLLVEEPFPFDERYERGIRVDLDGTGLPVVSLADLVELKRRAGRPRDLEDIAALEAIAREDGDG